MARPQSIAHRGLSGHEYENSRAAFRKARQSGAAIDGLADGYREVVVLHDIEGFTHEEIAGLLGIEPGTSKSQLSRARRILRAALAR